MTSLIGIAGIMLVDIAIWSVAWRLLPEPTAENDWRLVQRNMRIVLANVVVILVNVTVLVLLKIT